MKIIGLQKNIKQGVFATSHITGRHVNLPILNNLLLVAEEGGVKLISTNLEIGITAHIRSKVEESGSFTVDAKILSEYISLLPNKKVELRVKDDNLIIESDNYKTKIKGQSAEDYPLIPEINQQNYYSVDLVDFKNAVTQVIFAVSQDENRLALSGILFAINEGGLTLVATDSYRLAEKTIKLATNIPEPEDKKIIVPTRTLQELQRIMSGDYSDNKEDRTLKFYLSDNQILFTLDGVEVVSRLIEEQYPDYQQIIPKEYKTSCLVDKQELVRAIKASAIFAKSGINDVNLDFLQSKQQIMTSAISGQTGENITNLEAKIEGSDNSITINSRYLLDGINNVSTEMVKLELVDSNTPCLIKPVEQQQYLYVVMPIKR